MIRRIKDIDVVKDVGNDTNNTDTDTDSSNANVVVRGNDEKEEEEEKSSNLSPAIVLSDRLQLLNKIDDDKTTTQAQTIQPHTMPPPTTMPTITQTVRKNHSIVHMLVKGNNDDDDDDSYYEDFRKEWKIIGITQRSDRRIWLNHDEIMEECYKRYSNMKYKLLCVSVDIGGKLISMEC